MKYSNTKIKNNQSFFAKVEIILLFHFLVDLLPKIVQSPEKVSFSTHTQKTFHAILRKESRKPRRLQKSKSKSAYTLLAFSES